MHILDIIKLDGEIKKKMDQLCRDSKYNPTEIGSRILRACGYEVQQYLKGSIAVTDKEEKLLYYGE